MSERSRSDRSVDFTDFVAARYPALVRTARMLVANPADAEDLVQEALLKCAAAWHRIHGDPEAYVRTVLVRTNISRWRRRRVHEVPTEHLPETAVQQVAPSEFDAIAHAVAQLSPKQRAAVVLRHLEDRSERETAELMGCSVAAVKSRAASGLARLRELLADVGSVSCHVGTRELGAAGTEPSRR